MPIVKTLMQAWFKIWNLKREKLLPKKSKQESSMHIHEKSTFVLSRDPFLKIHPQIIKGFLCKKKFIINHSCVALLSFHDEKCWPTEFNRNATAA